MKTLPVPDSAVAEAARDLLVQAAPKYLVNHSERTYLFGSLCVEAADVDSEAAYIASLIHDIGLTAAFAGQQSFELVGAEVAARFLEQHGWPIERIALVESAIVRHTDLDPLDDPTMRIVQAGAALDVAGIPAEMATAGAVVSIIEDVPRTGFVDGILNAYFAEIEAQPTGVFAQLEATVQLSTLVPANPLCAHG